MSPLPLFARVLSMNSACLFVSASLVWLSTHAVAAEFPLAVVTMTDGRVVDGQLDDATDDEHLWLRRGDDRVLLSTSYRWDEVAAVFVGESEVTKEQILANRNQYLAAWPQYVVLGDQSLALPTAHCDEPLGRMPRAVSTSFEATLANWDGDVEPDGYEIAVTVFDEFGFPMPVRGTLMATLVGERSDGGSVPTEPVVLERWSERIDLGQFAGGPAVFRLPFRQIHPEVDLDIQPGGILEVEVGAFGQGRMASSAAVAIREFNAIRDRFELSTGERFFRGERWEHWRHE